MRKWGLASVLLAALVLPLTAGCRQGRLAPELDLPPPVIQGKPLSPLARGTKLDDERQFVILIRVHLIALDLPMGSTSDSAELWSYFNEEPVGARIGSTLGLNGVRVGLGRREDWADIRKILTGLTARSPYTWNFNARPTGVVAIPVKQRQPAQRIFQFRPDRTLFGNDYPPGDNVLTMVPTINYDDPSAVHLSGGLVIRSTASNPQYLERNGGYVLVNKPVIYPLPNLDFRLVLRPGEFLLVGPSKEADRRSSPGAAFLVSEREGIKFERVLVIVPEVFYSPLRSQG